MSDDAITDPQPSTPATSPRRRRRLRWALAALAGVLLLGLVMIIAAGGALYRAVHDEAGTRWLLSHVPYVVASGTRGALLGDFEAERLVVTLPGDGGTITLQAVGWRGLRLARSEVPDVWLRIAIDELHADRIDVALASKPGSNSPATPPTSLQSPVELDLAALRIDELHMAALGTAPLRELRARLHAGADAGRQHRIDDLSVAWDRLIAKGSLTIQSVAPFALDLKAEVAQASAPAVPASASALTWRVTASLNGPLDEPQLVAALRARADAQRPEQSLDLRATLRPFAAWPLGALQANAKALDLSALAAGAPLTSLDLDASATSSGADRPASVMARIVNDQAGRWSDGRLPLRRADVELRARPNDPGTLELPTLAIELGTRDAAAGRVTGSGRWTANEWSLAAALQSLDPARLDARAPAMQLSGPVTLTGRGFDGKTPDGGTVDAKADIAGRVSADGPLRNAQLVLDASLNAKRIDIRRLRVASGGASASMTGTALQANADAPWQVKAKAALVDFDPAPWWPGANPAWRRGPHRLNATGDIDLAVPLPKSNATSLQQLAAVRGQVALSIAKSQLAGVPLQGDLTLRSTDGSALTLALKLDAAGNTIAGDGRLATTGDGRADHWNLSLDAPSLEALRPIWRLGGASDSSFAGAATAKLQIDGRWPALTTQGRLDATGVRAGAASVQRAVADWKLDLVGNGAMNVQATLTQAALIDANPAAGETARRALESVRLAVTGTTRAHRLELTADTNALPPAWTDAMMARGAAPPTTAASASMPASPAVPVAGGRSVAVLQANGGFIDAGNATPPTRGASAATGALPAFSGWRGTLQQLDLHPSTNPDTPWVRTRDVALEARWAGATSVNVQPGRLQILSGALSWSRIAWQAASGNDAPRIDVDAEIEPLKISPLLARLQPSFGWGGELTLAGHIHLHSAPSFTADVVIERRSGDLTVTDEAGTQALGLTDLRFGVDAKDGTWNFTQGLAGTSLGVGAGAVVVRTSPQLLWPSADAPIQGTLELRVANLGTLGNWVPAGWRLEGALRTSATIAGRFGAPEYLGRIEGSGIGVRNFLEGVAITEGDIAIKLQGDSAHIERFTAKAGQGSVKLEGDASFGESPKADVRLTAEQFRLLGRVDRRVIVSGGARLQMGRDKLALAGRLGVDEGLIDFTRSDAPTLASDVEVLRRPRPAPVTTDPKRPPPKPAGRQLDLDLQVGLGEKLRLHGHGIDTGLRGDLRVTAPGGQLAVSGTINTFGGTYDAYGQKLTIDRGLLAFNGPIDNPRLDILATRSDTDVRVGVIVTGGAIDPRVRLYSDPDVSDMDKLSWLILGRASDGSDTALLQGAALALLAGDGQSKTDQFTKAIGLDQISVHQSDGDTRDTIVSLGKQISRRWYVGYERGLSTTAGSLQLIYRIAQRFTLRAQSGADSSLDFIWTWRWQ